MEEHIENEVLSRVSFTTGVNDRSKGESKVEGMGEIE